MSEFDLGSPRAGSAGNKRLPVVLCLDTSHSMGEMDDAPNVNGPKSRSLRRIDQLNAALKEWKTELAGSAQLRRQADICVVAFNTKPTTMDVGGGLSPGFVSVADFRPPTLTAAGVTRLDLAVVAAIAKVGQHRASTNVETHRAKIWVISDGKPTDNDGKHPSDLWKSVLPAVHEGEQRQDFALYTAGVYGADMAVLDELGGKGSFDLRGLSLARVLKVVTDTIGTARSGATVDAEKATVADTVDKMRHIFRTLGK